MVSPRSEAQYTKAELLAEAHAAGFSVSDRLITDWVSLGLLDKATRRGRGRGRGLTATWPAQQRELLLAVLSKRQETPHIAPLCNIPVFVWLWWGDAYIPTRQVRRALNTWIGKNERGRSWRAAHEAATAVADQFAHSDAPASARAAFVRTIAETIVGRPFDPDLILRQLRDVFDPHQENRSIGPPALNFRPEHFVLIVRDRLAAISGLREERVDEEIFHWARREYRVSRRDYEKIVLSIAHDPEAVDTFFRKTPGGVAVPDITLDDVANNACRDLLTMIGLYLVEVAPNT